MINVFILYFSVWLPCLLMLPSVCPFLPFACVPLVTGVYLISNLLNSLMSLKLSYCTLLAWPIILFHRLLGLAWSVITQVYPASCIWPLIVIIYILSCEFIKVHIFRVTGVLLFKIIFSSSYRIIFISSCTSAQWFADKLIIKWTTVCPTCYCQWQCDIRAMGW